MAEEIPSLFHQVVETELAACLLICHKGQTDWPPKSCTRFLNRPEGHKGTDDSVLIILNAPTYYPVPLHLDLVRIARTMSIWERTHTVGALFPPFHLAARLGR